jgi:hypothetical protein
MKFEMDGHLCRIGPTPAKASYVSKWLGKDTGSGQPVGFSGRVGRVRVAGQPFSRPEPVVPVRIQKNVTKDWKKCE